MTRGLKRSQIGISEEMIQTYGESIFEMSHNIQVRRGDAVAGAVAAPAAARVSRGGGGGDTRARRER